MDLLKLNDEEIVEVAEALRERASSSETAASDAERVDADAACMAAAQCDATGAQDDAAVARAAAAIGRAARASSVVVTRGDKGAVFWQGGGSAPEEAESAWVCAGFVAPAIADTVGAGDAFLAGLLSSRLIGGATASACLDAGCRLGAYVAGQPGATPQHDQDAIDALDACILVEEDDEGEEGCAVPAPSFAIPVEL